MPGCGDCEGLVTEQYVKVFAPNRFDTVRVCPNYEGKHSEGTEIREAYSSRQVYG